MVYQRRMTCVTRASCTSLKCEPSILATIHPSPLESKEIRQASQDMPDLVSYAVGDLASCLRLVIYVSNMDK